MRAIIAARLSTIFGQTGIDSQDKISRDWCESMGHTVVEVIPDRKSGTVPPWKRPKLRPWLTDPAKLVQYDAVVGSTFDRLSRGDKKSTTEIEQWARDNNKQLLTVDGLRFPCEGEDGIRWDLAARLAHAEWLRISRRYKAMQSYLTDEGYLVGRPPYGYQVVGVDCGESPCPCKNDRKALEFNPETSEVIRQMVDWYLEGNSLVGIARQLNSNGVPPSNSTTAQWDGMIIGRMLRNETLIGKRRNGDGKIVLRFEPLIDMGKWRKLQAALTANSRRHGAIRPVPGMLTGIAYCGICKGPLHYRKITSGKRAKSTGKTSVWLGYRCDGTPENPSRCKVMITGTTVDGWVNMQMTGPSIGPLPVFETHVTPGHNHEDDIDRVEQDLRDLDLDDPRYDAKHEALRAERTRLKALPVEPPKLAKQQTGETVLQRWQRLDASQRRNYLLRANAKVYVVGKQPSDGWLLDVEHPNELAS